MRKATLRELGFERQGFLRMVLRGSLIVIFGGLIWWLMAYLLHPVSWDPWLSGQSAFALAVPVLLIILPVAVLGLVSRDSPGAWVAWCMVVLPLSVIVVLTPAAIQVSAAVSAAWQASTIAGGDPYCLQVETRRGEWPWRASRPVSAWSDLLKMESVHGTIGGTGEYSLFYHAVLVVRRNGTDELRNWSYRRMAFDGMTQERQYDWVRHLNEPVCTPVRGFLGGLPVFAALH